MPLVLSLWSIDGDYLETQFDASVGQILIVGELVPLLTLTTYILINHDAKSQFICSLQLLSTVTTDIDARDHYVALFLRSMFGGICTCLYLLALGLGDSVGDITALYRTTMLLFSIVFTKILLGKTPSLLTIFFIIPLAIFGVLFICQPTWIFESNNANVSSLGICLIVLCGFLRTSCNLIVKKRNEIAWYIINLYVSMVGVLVGLSVLVFDYCISNKQNVWNLFISNSTETALANILLILFGVSQFLVLFLETILYQKGEFLYTAAVTTCLRLLYIYFLEWLIFGTALNLWSYLGMIVIIIATAVYNIQIVYNQIQQQQQQQHDYEQDIQGIQEIQGIQGIQMSASDSTSNINITSGCDGDSHSHSHSHSDCDTDCQLQETMPLKQGICL